LGCNGKVTKTQFNTLEQAAMSGSRRSAVSEATGRVVFVSSTRKDCCSFLEKWWRYPVYSQGRYKTAVGVAWRRA
jgi:hypothetical protein